MHFEPGSLPFGVSPAILIDCAKQLAHEDSFSSDGFCRALGATRSEGKVILSAAIAGGLVEPNAQATDLTLPLNSVSHNRDQELACLA